MALKKCWKVVQLSIRSSDVFARNGGEEFVLLLPTVNREVAQRIASRIRTSVERQATTFKDASFNFTVSMGLVHRDSVDMSIEELLSAAD